MPSSPHSRATHPTSSQSLIPWPELDHNRQQPTPTHASGGLDDIATQLSHRPAETGRAWLSRRASPACQRRRPISVGIATTLECRPAALDASAQSSPRVRSCREGKRVTAPRVRELRHIGLKSLTATTLWENRAARGLPQRRHPTSTQTQHPSATGRGSRGAELT
jgi:hypothetical protein